MKRKNAKVPGFDEIIFENRNKVYGAYDLRKRYNSIASISILGGISFCAMLIAVFSLSTEKGTATVGPTTVIIEMADPVIPDIPLPEIKPPAEVAAAIKNLAPVVTEDTSDFFIPPPLTDEILETEMNGNINDTIIFTETYDPIVPPEPEPFINVKEMPEFPGGTEALMRYIFDNLSYPEDAINNNIQGRVVIKFVVKPDGSVGRIEIAGSIHPSLDEEAVRVVKSLPTFKPGKQDGVPVPVWFIVPVLFRLEKN
jgi:periplasmic protein TonB